MKDLAPNTHNTIELVPEGPYLGATALIGVADPTCVSYTWNIQRPHPEQYAAAIHKAATFIQTIEKPGVYPFTKIQAMFLHRSDREYVRIPDAQTDMWALEQNSHVLRSGQKTATHAAYKIVPDPASSEAKLFLELDGIVNLRMRELADMHGEDEVIPLRWFEAFNLHRSVASLTDPVDRHLRSLATTHPWLYKHRTEGGSRDPNLRTYSIRRPQAYNATHIPSAERLRLFRSSLSAVDLYTKDLLAETIYGTNFLGPKTDRLFRKMLDSSPGYTKLNDSEVYMITLANQRPSDAWNDLRSWADIAEQVVTKARTSEYVQNVALYKVHEFAQQQGSMPQTDREKHLLKMLVLAQKGVVNFDSYRGVFNLSMG